MARLHEYIAWAAGLMPEHRVSRGELSLFANGFGKPQPVAVIGVPTKKR